MIYLILIVGVEILVIALIGWLVARNPSGTSTPDVPYAPVAGCDAPVSGHHGPSDGGASHGGGTSHG